MAAEPWRGGDEGGDEGGGCGGGGTDGGGGNHKHERTLYILPLDSTQDLKIFATLLCLYPTCRPVRLPCQLSGCSRTCDVN